MVKPEDIVIPERVMAAINSYYGDCGGTDHAAPLWPVRVAFAALANNPIVPKRRDLEKIEREFSVSVGVDFELGAIEWQRRMFLRRELEVPEDLKNLVYMDDQRITTQGNKFNERLLAAYELGKQSNQKESA